GTQVGKIDKILLSPPMLDLPQGLDRVYFLRRSQSPGPLRIDRCAPDPLRLLAHSFNTYVHSGARVVNQLAVHAGVVETVGMFTVAIPPSCPAVKVAAAVRTHAGGPR